MQNIQKLETFLGRFPILVLIESKAPPGIPLIKTIVALVGALFTSASLYFHAIAWLSSNVIALGFPMGKLLIAINAKDSNKLEQYSLYYAALAAWMTFEQLHLLQERVPFYYFVKAAAVVWLTGSHFDGISTLAKIVRPHIATLCCAKKVVFVPSSAAIEVEKSD